MSVSGQTTSLKEMQVFHLARVNLMSIVSCPGKVLVAGGYLVLDQEYQGLVVGTDARLYSAVQSVADLDKHGLAPNHVPADNLQNISNKQEVARIKVVSAQFHEAVWNYGVYVDEKSEIEIHQLFDQAGDNGDEGKPKNTNRFIEATLRATLFVINNIDDSKKLVSSKLKDLRIILAADNDFYSQSQALKERGLPPTTLGLSNLPKFCHTKCTLTNVNKTGLGSSAAMVTSLVGSLLHHFGVVGNLSSQSDSDKAKVEADKALIHNISQYAHCLAQGKIGSGFDVSSAIYGSHIYNRFSPNVIADAMGNESDAKLVAKTCLNSSIWNNKVTEVKIPPGFILRLADVDTGSHTPSMVSKVIRWRKNNPNEASKLWEKISNTNQRICEIWKELSDISEQDPESYISGITQCSALPYSKWKTQADRNKTMDLLIELGGTCKTVRSLLKELGDNSDVPIEPSEQTRLLDACMECPGVVMAGVPGGN
ncbi:phosphomevalonate kinase [Mycoemilia scoparia]|uniref:Phosphomevalonate kinase n=1 Tax=Mycoemilia scoparia TaxID=417184 RepID=A0A9W7ZXC8_9FUNG|nr:phosphomevalonate kinase [Mycoemilia scoparia]